MEEENYDLALPEAQKPKELHFKLHIDADQLIEMDEAEKKERISSLMNYFTYVVRYTSQHKKISIPEKLNTKSKLIFTKYLSALINVNDIWDTGME